METILVDTGALLALLIAGDHRHRQARIILNRLKTEKITPLLTNFIVAETHTVLTWRVGRDAGRTWLRHNIWPVERVTEDDERRAREILLEGPAGEISYTDATSFALMERLGLDTAFAFDSSFEERGFKLINI